MKNDMAGNCQSLFLFKNKFQFRAVGSFFMVGGAESTRSNHQSFFIPDFVAENLKSSKN